MTTVKRILEISHSGLKAHDRTLALGDVTILAGPNGTGKTTAHDAIRLTVFGRTTGIDATNQGVMTLARDNQIATALRVEMADRTVHTVEREWKRDRKGAVSQTIRIDGSKVSTDDGKATIAGWFRGFDEAGAESFFSMSAAKKREQLLRIIPAEGDLSMERVIPGNCPTWALPKHGAMHPSDWVAWAITQADEKIRGAQADIRDAEKAIERDTVGTIHQAQREIDTAEISARLAKLRAEGVAAGQREQAERTAASLRVQVTEAEQAAQVVVRELDLVRLAAKVAEALPAEAIARVRQTAAEATERYEMASGRVASSLVQAHAEVLHGVHAIASERRRSADDITRAEKRVNLARSKLGTVATFAPATDADVAAARLAFGPLNADAETEARAVMVIEARIDALRVPEVECCPRCSYSFVEAVAAKRADAESDLAMARMLADSARAAAEEAAEAVRLAEGGVKRTLADRELAEAEADLVRAKALAPRIPAEVTDVSAWLNGIEGAADLVLEAAEAKVRAESTLGGLRSDLADAEANLAMMPAAERTAAAIEAEIRTAEADLSRAARHNANAERLREADGTIEALTIHLDLYKAARETFVGIQAHLVRQAKPWLERRYSEMLGGMPVEVVLVTPTGAPDCVVRVDGISVSTLCPGHKAFALAYFVILLASVQGDGFRFLPVDELEKISAENRAHFIRAMLDAVAEGVLDQCLLSGCADTIPEIDGVSTHLLTTNPETETAPRRRSLTLIETSA